MDKRRLTLRADRLTELTPADLTAVAAGATTLGCYTKDLVCDPSAQVNSFCCGTGWGCSD